MTRLNNSNNLYWWSQPWKEFRAAGEHMNYCSLQRSNWHACPKGSQEMLLYVPTLQETSESFKTILGSDALNGGESGQWCLETDTYLYLSITFPFPNNSCHLRVSKEYFEKTWESRGEMIWYMEVAETKLNHFFIVVARADCAHLICKMLEEHLQCVDGCKKKSKAGVIFTFWISSPSHRHSIFLPILSFKLHYPLVSIFETLREILLSDLMSAILSTHGICVLKILFGDYASFHIVLPSTQLWWW